MRSFSRSDKITYQDPDDIVRVLKNCPICKSRKKDRKTGEMISVEWINAPVSFDTETTSFEVDGEKSYSEKSTVIDTATSPSQVKALVNDKKGTDYLRIKWEKSEGASGYVIYRKTDNEDDYETEVTYDEYGNAEYTSKVGKYVKHAVVSDGNKTTFEEKNLNSCQAYSYRVVPYFKSKGKYYYGDYREIILALFLVYKTFYL